MCPTLIFGKSAKDGRPLTYESQGKDCYGTFTELTPSVYLTDT